MYRFKLELLDARDVQSLVLPNETCVQTRHPLFIIISMSVCLAVCLSLSVFASWVRYSCNEGCLSCLTSTARTDMPHHQTQPRPRLQIMRKKQRWNSPCRHQASNLERSLDTALNGWLVLHGLAAGSCYSFSELKAEPGSCAQASPRAPCISRQAFAP